MAALVKGERRADQHAVLLRANAMQQRRHVAVIAQGIGRAAIDRDRRSGCDRQRPVAEIGQRHLHQLDGIVAGGHDIGHFSAQPQLPVLARHLVPEQSGLQRHRLAAVFVKGLRDLRGGVARRRPRCEPIDGDPKVTSRARIM